MIYQLGTLEKWTRKDINPETLQQASESDLARLIDFVTIEKDAICNYFRDKAIGTPPLPTIKFIQAHQVGIAAITETILGYKRSGQYQIPEALHTFYTGVCILLDEITRFIRHHLPEYFDERLSILPVHADLARIDLANQLNQLSPLESHPQVDRTLFRMATLFIRHFIEEKRQINYVELRYYKELISRMQGLLDLEAEADMIYELHLVLFQLNFNYPRYVLYFTFWLDSQLARIADRSKRLEQLSWHIHAIEQIRPKPGYILFHDLPTLSEQLMASIQTTYQYLLNEEKPPNPVVVEQISSNLTNAHPKIQLSMSVPQLALFLKILFKAGVITNTNKADVFRIVAAHVTTRKSEKISYESLRGKYSSPPPVAYHQLRIVLLKMLDYIKSPSRNVDKNQG